MLYAGPSHNTTQQHLHHYHSITQTTPTTTACSSNDEDLLLPPDISLLLHNIQTIIQCNIKVIKEFCNDMHRRINPSPTNLPNSMQTIDTLFQHLPVTPENIDVTTKAPDTCFPATNDNYGPNKFPLEVNTATTNCNSFQTQPRTPNTINEPQQQNTSNATLHTLTVGCRLNYRYFGQECKHTDNAH